MFVCVPLSELYLAWSATSLLANLAGIRLFLRTLIGSIVTNGSVELVASAIRCFSLFSLLRFPRWFSCLHNCFDTFTRRPITVTYNDLEVHVCNLCDGNQPSPWQLPSTPVAIEEAIKAEVWKCFQGWNSTCPSINAAITDCYAAIRSCQNRPSTLTGANSRIHLQAHSSSAWWWLAKIFQLKWPRDETVKPEQLYYLGKHAISSATSKV